LYFYGARYYDPVLGRFISADPTTARPFDPQALNRYSYARNNPLRFIDPSGHLFEDYTLNCPFCFDTSIGLDYTLDASLTMNSASDSLSSSINANLTYNYPDVSSSLNGISSSAVANSLSSGGTTLTNSQLGQVSTPGFTLVAYYPNTIDPGSGGSAAQTAILDKGSVTITTDHLLKFSLLTTGFAMGDMVSAQLRMTTIGFNERLGSFNLPDWQPYGSMLSEPVESFKDTPGGVYGVANFQYSLTQLDVNMRAQNPLYLQMLPLNFPGDRNNAPFLTFGSTGVVPCGGGLPQCNLLNY
jgi:hypothetical protein